MTHSVDSGVVLDAIDVSRHFDRGAVQALKGVSLSIQTGQIHALLGPNGAGKTTLVKICSTLLLPTSGQIYVGGIDAIRSPYEARKSLGIVLGGDLGFYPRASARENLCFFADIQGVPGRERNAQVAKVLEKVALSADAERKVGTFSRGMVQRLHIARALMNEPALLLLDEPTNGLDPDIAHLVRGLIRTLADDGVGVLLTSHQLAEVEELSDTISIIQDGRITMRGDVAQIAHAGGVTDVSVLMLDPQDKDLAEGISRVLPGLVRVETRAHGGKWRVNIFWSETPSGQTLAELSGYLGNYAGRLFTRPTTLEEAYLSVLSLAS
ncbi:MAG: ABC transporter ATP-binding protein [Trueperella sp.]|uniref:ABC transporter ATP-binding protein n=1 Tax=Trueperella sp. TaxID=2699835 RepID=UPI0026002835|nr:ABC transporter ATP-binding protein [Trueperella sp.]MCI7306092.1 ABC transporter ATP-binding protein [Trueperella sp.]